MGTTRVAVHTISHDDVGPKSWCWFAQWSVSSTHRSHDSQSICASLQVHTLLLTICSLLSRPSASSHAAPSAKMLICSEIHYYAKII